MEVVRLETPEETVGEVRLSIINEVVRIISITEPEVRITGVSAAGPRGPKGDPGGYSPDAIVAVLHGDDPDFPRPLDALVAFWFGTVIPNNSLDLDHIIVPDSIIV